MQWNTFDSSGITCIGINSDGLSNFVFIKSYLGNTFSEPLFWAWHYNPPLFSNPTDLILPPIVGFDLRKCVADPLLTVTTFLCSAINSSASCAAHQSQNVGAFSKFPSRGSYTSLSLLLALRILTMLYNVCTICINYTQLDIYLSNKFDQDSFDASAD